MSRYLLESGAPDGYRLEDDSGVLLIDEPENHDGAIAATGSGAFSQVGRKGAQVAGDFTGAGVLSWSEVTNRLRSLVSAGGGVAAFGSKGAHTASIDASGGGALTKTSTTNRPSTIDATASGDVNLSQQSGRAAALTVVGGGRLSFSETTARLGALAATGSGELTFTGTQLEAHAGSFAATGGGIFTLTKLGVITPVVDTAEGQAPVRLYRIPKGKGSIKATAHGRFHVVGVADWNDDELVLDMDLSA